MARHRVQQALRTVSNCLAFAAPPLEVFRLCFAYGFWGYKYCTFTVILDQPRIYIFFIYPVLYFRGWYMYCTQGGGKTERKLLAIGKTGVTDGRSDLGGTAVIPSKT